MAERLEEQFLAGGKGVRRMGEIVSLFATVYVQWIVILVVVDVILGIIAALTKGDINLSQLAKFMKKNVLPYILGFAVIELVAQAWPAYAMIVPVVFIIIVIALAASILGNLGKLGLPVPKMVKK